MQSLIVARVGLIATFLGASVFGCAPKHPDNPALDAFPPGVAGSTEVTYYDVHGRTARELVTQMRELGPKLSTGAYWAETQSPMRWTWQSKATGGGFCRLTAVQVLVRTEMTMPRWVPPADTEPGLYDAWKQSMAGLQTHEIGHKDISARAAREVLQQLNNVHSYCNGLSAEVKRLTDGIMARLAKEQVQYDATTRHGATQGTAFPPRPVVRSTPR